MLRGAVGAGDRLLLLLGDSDESKGRISVPRLPFSGFTVRLRARVDVSSLDKAQAEPRSLSLSLGSVLSAAPVLRGPR